MTLPVIFHELAENELNEAAEYYAQALAAQDAVMPATLARAVRGRPAHGGRPLRDEEDESAP